MARPKRTGQEFRVWQQRRRFRNGDVADGTDYKSGRTGAEADALVSPMSVAMLRESTLLAVAVAVLAAAVSTHSPPYAMPFDYARAFQAANGYVLATSPWSLQWRSAAAAAAASYQPRVPAAKNAHGYYGLSDQEALVEINALKEEGPGGPSDGLLSSLSETIEASMQSRQSSNFLALVSNVLQRYGAAVSSVSSLMESYVSSVSSARLTPLSGYTDGLSTISSLLSDVRSKSSVASVSSAAMASAAASAVSLRRLSARLLRESLAASYRYDRIEEWSTANSVLYEAVSTSYSSVSASASLAASSLSAALSDYASVMSDIESSRSSTVSSLVSHLFHGSLFAAGRSAQGASLPFIEATRLSAP